MGLIRFANNNKQFVELVFDDEIDCEATFDDILLFLGGKTLTKSRDDPTIIRMSLKNLEYLVISAGWELDLDYEEDVLIELRDFSSKQQQFIEPTEKIWTQAKIKQHLVDEYSTKRTPTSFQLENLEKMLLRKSAASFSVPGSGKTSEGLCYWLCNRTEGEKLLVVLPKVGFTAWEDEFKEWIGWGAEQVIRLDVPSDKLKDRIDSMIDAKVYLITYARLWRNEIQLSEIMAQGEWSMILDESHNIKRDSGSYSQSVRNIGNYARCTRLILTGTPAPQGKNDLLAQVQFLRNARMNVDDCVEWINEIKVRTTKKQLKLMETKTITIIKPLPAAHKKMYDLLTSRLFRRKEAEGDEEYLNRLNSMRRHIMDIMRAATNPRILCEMEEFVGKLTEQDITDVLNTESWKMKETVELVNKLVNQDKKVIIWSIFNENTDRLAAHLSHLNPRIIRGSTPSAEIHPGTVVDDLDGGTREGILRDFKEENSCRVLIANPAACGESISLHHWCHDAIYFDRNYNAGQFLQSCDRIHRYGTYPGTNNITCAQIQVTYYLLISKDTIDERISARLEEKIDRQKRILNSGDYSESLDEKGTTSSDASGMSNKDIEDFLEYAESTAEVSS